MTKKRLLLIGWDSADWKLIRPLSAEGKLPACTRLVAGGVSGDLTTLEPQLSPMLWTSIATGKHAYHHGVSGFTEIDAQGHVVPVSAATRQSKALWEMLGERGLKSHVVGWFATQGEQMPAGGCLVSNLYHSFKHEEDDAPEDWPPPPAGTYFPPDLAQDLNTLRVSPWDIDGDEVIRLFVAKADQIDQTKDRRLWHLAQRLAEAFSVHAASCWLMENRPDWDFMAVYYRAIDEICHEFMQFHPPQIEGTSDVDFELYREVVEGAYRIHDMMMSRLIQLAGPDTTVMLVSDHGFHSDHLRPRFTPHVPAGITVWHRPQGVFTVTGPGWQQGKEIHGARLLDIAPTILTYFGLPVGMDMEGRVLLEAFAEKPDVLKIASWEETGRNHVSPDAAPSEADNRALLDQFVALGYINEISADPTEAALETRQENTWSMARACMDAGRCEQALPMLEEIYHSRPERTDWAQLLARCQMRLGLLDEAEATAQATLSTFEGTQAVASHMIQANIAIERKQAAKALGHLKVVGEKLPRDLQMLSLTIEALLRLRRYDECSAVCLTTLEVDPHSALAHIGLARCALHERDTETAMEHALKAIGFQYGNCRGHFLLGVALHDSGQYPAAVQALQTAIDLSTRFFTAGRCLVSALEMTGQVDAAEQTRLKFLFLRHQLRQTTQTGIGRIRAESAARVPGFILAREKREAEAEARGISYVPPDQEFILVSGLPRSGTSLMMQMLRAGGLESMTDGLRAPDEDNPEGYWEWEEIKKMPKWPLVIEKAQGKATKVISALLASLPPKHKYRIIFMTRPVEEVVASQMTMLERRGTSGKSHVTDLQEKQSSHVRDMLVALRNHARVSLLEVDYTELVAEPARVSALVAAFLGEALTTPMAMASAVKADLYRNKRS